MKSKIGIYLISFFFIIFNIFCKTRNNNKESINTENHLSKSDTFIKDILMDSNGHPISYYFNKKIIESKLDLENIEEGYDSLQIRIWYGYAFMDSGQLIVLKNNSYKWNGELIAFRYNYNESRDSLKSISKSVFLKEPKSGWDHLLKKIISLKLLTLPDMDKIKNYPLIADGDGVVVEVATTKNYRIYSYQEPGLAAKYNITEANNMETISKVLEQEFSFDRLRKPEKTHVSNRKIEVRPSVYDTSSH